MGSLRIVGWNDGSRGDVDPLVELLAAAQRRGHSVLACSTPEWAPRFEAKGVPVSASFAASCTCVRAPFGRYSLFADCRSNGRLLSLACFFDSKSVAMECVKHAFHCALLPCGLSLALFRVERGPPR